VVTVKEKKAFFSEIFPEKRPGVAGKIVREKDAKRPETLR